MFYWSLGRDIVNLQAESKWGSKLLKNLSEDLKKALPDVGCFSETNLKYMKYFYELYSNVGAICPQVEDKSGASIIRPQVGDKIPFDIFSIPWGHHKLLIDKYKKHPEKALFFVRKTIENDWSRAMLLNFIHTDLYERDSKAQNNFQHTLPSKYMIQFNLGVSTRETVEIKTIDTDFFNFD